MDGPEDKEFARRLCKGTGVDATVSAATCVAVSLNFKDKYAPIFPAWPSVWSIRGRRPDAVTLEKRFVAARNAPAPALTPRSYARPGNRRWPISSAASKAHPAIATATAPDISRADFVWCTTALAGVENRSAADRRKREGARERAKASSPDSRNAPAAVARGWKSGTSRPVVPDWR